MGQWVDTVCTVVKEENMKKVSYVVLIFNKIWHIKSHAKLQTQFILACSDEFDTNRFSNTKMIKPRITLITCCINTVLYAKKGY